MIDPELRRACRTCGASIVWAKTPTGKSMPVDFEPASGGNVILDEGPEGLLAVLCHESAVVDKPRHKAHFATCPQAAEHRRARNKQGDRV
jgi:hypothetical protein